MMVVLTCATIIIMNLIGCVKTQEVIREIHTTDSVFIHTTDTFTIHHQDTIKDVRFIESHDTIREIQTRVITLKESGDTIREIVNNNIYHYVQVKDSSDKYRHVIDSLKSKITELSIQKRDSTNNQQTTTVIEKKHNDWFTKIILILVLLIGGGIVILLNKKTEK